MTRLKVLLRLCQFVTKGLVIYDLPLCPKAGKRWFFSKITGLLLCKKCQQFDRDTLTDHKGLHWKHGVKGFKDEICVTRREGERSIDL